MGATRVQVFVRDNDVEQALRALKKKMQREGVLREMRAVASMRSRQTRLQERKLKPCGDRTSRRASRPFETG
jgi:small subunit ribosomal protein S21